MDLVKEMKAYLIDLAEDVVSKNHGGRFCLKNWNRSLSGALAGMEHRPSETGAV